MRRLEPSKRPSSQPLDVESGAKVGAGGIARAYWLRTQGPGAGLRVQRGFEAIERVRDGV